MSVALLFPGQGVQHHAMLPWLDEHPLAADTLAWMGNYIGADWRERLADDAWSGSNAVAQCLLVGVSLAAFRVVAAKLPRPVAMAGYSVGELAACAAAGMFDDSESLQLAHRRAVAMDACAAAVESGLLSANGVENHVVDAVCARFGVWIAIRISVDRCVLGGPLDALAAATQMLVDTGAEVVPLRVALAAHTPMMAPAGDAFATIIAPLPWRNADVVIASNIDGRGRRDASALKIALSRQIATTVRWDRCMDTIAERGPRCVLEVGPGSALSRMWATRHADVPARSVDEFRSADAVAEWVARMGAS